jgi:N-acetyl-1-D-myo-inositol-2-amino-2-deoxy-alpha-D-glucopyranoside deacetylase
VSFVVRCLMNIKNPTLLSVLAHPDDESFGMGGTLALYAQRGVAVHLICATRGEAGDVDEPYLQGFRSKAERRESELRCAAMKLGLAGVQFLGYRDSGMPGTPDNQHPQALINAPLEQVAAQVAYAIRALRPQVVLTFDPIGGYKHPDHIAIHKATVRAFELAGQADYQDGLPPYQPEKLYFHVIPKGYLRLAVGLMPLFGRDPRHFGRNGDVDLISLVKDGDFPIRRQQPKTTPHCAMKASSEGHRCAAGRCAGRRCSLGRKSISCALTRRPRTDAARWTCLPIYKYSSVML